MQWFLAGRGGWTPAGRLGRLWVVVSRWHQTPIAIALELQHVGVETLQRRPVAHADEGQIALHQELIEQLSVLTSKALVASSSTT